jgi:serine/threonine protein phosphatase PrpC
MGVQISSRGAVGAAEIIEIEIVSGDAKPGDQFLLASDGLTRIVRDDELAAELCSGSPAQAADNLIETVLARGAPDNVSRIITKFYSLASYAIQNAPEILASYHGRFLAQGKPAMAAELLTRAWA